MEFFIIFSFFVLALTGDGASTKKHANRKAIDFFDEDAFLEHLKTLFPAKADLNAIKGKVETLESTLGNRMCQVGSTGCWSADSCGMSGADYDKHGQSWTTITKSLSITFPKAFPKEPTVEVAMNGAKLSTPKGEDSYGWHATSSDVTPTGFTMNLHMMDRYFYGIKGTWIACTN